jgi:hypothetical protein
MSAFGWVAERYDDGSVEWWDGTDWSESLNDGARIYANEKRFDLEDANWVEVYQHEDNVLTTEMCLGDDCQDCEDVRESNARQRGDVTNMGDTHDYDNKKES